MKIKNGYTKVYRTYFYLAIIAEIVVPLLSESLALHAEIAAELGVFAVFFFAKV